MYIPFWIVAVAAIIAIYFYSKSKKSFPSKDSLSVEKMWIQAQNNVARVQEKSPLLENYLQDERDMVKAMEKDMLRLRERYKHNDIKQKEIARDWMDYSDAVAEVKFARELLDVDTEDDAYDRFDENTKEAFLTIQEVAKRVEDELGKDSNSKIVHDRLRKHAETVSEILNKNTKK